jgi:hypothetical protein
MPEIEWLYRYNDTAVSETVDAEMEVYATGVMLSLWQYPVLSRTPKGVWIDTGCNERRWVNLNSKKQFASATKEEALDHFKARKARQLHIYRSRVKYVKMVLRKIDDQRLVDSIRPIKMVVHFEENVT